MAVIIRVDGTREDLEPANGTDFSLEEMYAAINTDMVEFVNTIDGRLMIIDEEGKIKGKPLNREATLLYPYGTIDRIVGDVLICEPDQIR